MKKNSLYDQSDCVRMGALNSFELLTLVKLLLMKCNGGNLIRLVGYLL